MSNSSQRGSSAQTFYTKAPLGPAKENSSTSSGAVATSAPPTPAENEYRKSNRKSQQGALCMWRLDRKTFNASSSKTQKIPCTA